MTSTTRWNLYGGLVLVGAALCAFIAVRLRDHYGWEEADAKLALASACTAAGIFAGTVGLIARRRLSAALAYAMVGASLVIALIFAYYVVRMFTTADYS